MGAGRDGDTASRRIGRERRLPEPIAEAESDAFTQAAEWTAKLLTQPSSNPPQQDREDGGGVAEIFRELREDAGAVAGIARAINTASISDAPEHPRALAAIDAIFAYFVSKPQPLTQPEADPEVPRGRNTWPSDDEFDRLIGLCEMNLRDTAQGVEATEPQRDGLADKLRRLRDRGPGYSTEQARMRLRETFATHEPPSDGTGEEYFIRAAFPDCQPTRELLGEEGLWRCPKHGVLQPEKLAHNWGEGEPGEYGTCPIMEDEDTGCGRKMERNQ